MSRFIGDKRKVVCLIIIVCIVFLSLLGILFVGRTTAGHTACIYSNGRLIKIVELDSESEQTFTVYSDGGGYNVIKVSGGAISVSDADCPDKICVKTAPVSDGIQPIVCMPLTSWLSVLKQDWNTAMTVKKTVFSALLAVMSLTLYIVEGMIPPVVAIPGFSRSCVLPCSFLTVSRRSMDSI